MWVGFYAIGVFIGILAYAILAPGYFITTLLFLVAGIWCTIKLAKWFELCQDADGCFQRPLLLLQLKKFFILSSLNSA